MKLVFTLPVITLLLTMSACNSRDVEPQKNAKPNIIFIMADDLGWGEVGSFGQKRVATPNLDALAIEGIKLTNFYSASTVCAPSRESLMVGKHVGTTGRYKNTGHPIKAREITIAETLKDAGYNTAMYGKWGLGDATTEGDPNKQGFDDWLGFVSHGRAHFHYPEWLWKNGEKLEIPENNGRQGESYAHNIFVDAALEFIDEGSEPSKAEPFFLYMPMTLPHADIIVPENELNKFKGSFPEIPFEGGHYTAQLHPNAATAAMITMIDDSVGEIRRKLRKKGIEDNTIIIFTSDNGPVAVGGRDPEFFDATGPLRGVKRDLYEGGIRVPFIAHWPKNIPAGLVSDLPSSLVDMLPTLGEMTGGEITHEIDGVSILPTLLGKEQNLTGRTLYWVYEGRKLNGSVSDRSLWGERYFVEAVRRGRYKMLRYNRDTIELYDLGVDIGETNDISLEMPDLVRELSEFMNTEFIAPK